MLVKKKKKKKKKKKEKESSCSSAKIIDRLSYERVPATHESRHFVHVYGRGGTHARKCVEGMRIINQIQFQRTPVLHEEFLITAKENTYIYR